MGFMCDFCGEQRSVVYCRSDAASLCLSCDRNVHSANALSRRHSRTLVCERCNFQPAFVRCIEEKISLCPNCDWIGHGSSSTSYTHKKQAVSCYSGCPSAAELSTIWSFFLDFPSVGEQPCEQVLGSMSINECPQDSQGTQAKSTIEDASLAAELTSSQNVEKSSVWTGSSLLPPDTKVQNVEQPAGSTYSAVPKVYGSGTGTKGAPLCGDSFYENFNMDEVDLSIEDFDELLGADLDYPEKLFEDDEIGDLFGMEISGADSNCQDAPVVAVSAGRINTIQPTCSNAASADSLMSCKEEPNLCFARQAHASLSFSGITGESSAGDYQDCGASSMLLTGEPPPWFPPFSESSFPSSSRSNAVMRYKEKKKTRKFEKKVRYASRKARADVRRRVKGRFVKAGDAYDYDPLSQTRSY